MKITEIIKDAFIFPSKNTGILAMYLILSVLLTVFACGGIITYQFGFINSDNYLIGGMYLIIAMLIGFIVYGYNIRVIKSGIERDEEIPHFELFENFMSGFENTVVTLYYFIIPTLIVVVAGYSANVLGNAWAIVREFASQIINVYIIGSSTGFEFNALYYTITNFVISLAITLIVALIVFAIFSILKYSSQARLANTGCLKEGLSIYEATKDIIRIGLIKTIALFIIFVVIFSIINIIILYLFQYYPILLSIAYIILTPYLALAAHRAIGLTYSDIA